MSEEDNKHQHKGTLVTDGASTPIKVVKKGAETPVKPKPKPKPKPAEN